MIAKATEKLSKLFTSDEPIPPLPSDLTREDLWRMLNSKGRILKPPVEMAARLILEDAAFAVLTPEQIAEIIRETYRMYGLHCNCSGASIRWYMSQKNLAWNIIKRSNS